MADDSYSDDGFEVDDLTLTSTGPIVLEETTTVISMEESFVAEDENPAALPALAGTSSPTSSATASSFTGSAAQSKRAESLRRTNAALKRQLAELQANSTQGTSDETVQRIRAVLQSKVDALELAKKKLAHAKAVEKKLKARSGATQAERFVNLETALLQKEKEVTQLKEANKRLVTHQRVMTKRLEEADRAEMEWPRQLSSLTTDMEVARSRHKKARQAHHLGQEGMRKQHESMMGLIAKNRKLQKELQRIGQSTGKSQAEREKLRQLEALDSERAELMYEISKAERAKGGQKAGLQRQLREISLEVRNLDHELELKAAALEEKEREIRVQVLQVTKLKKRLREVGQAKGLLWTPSDLSVQLSEASKNKKPTTLVLVGLDSPSAKRSTLPHKPSGLRRVAETPKSPPTRPKASSGPKPAPAVAAEAEAEMESIGGFDAPPDNAVDPSASEEKKGDESDEEDEEAHAYEDDEFEDDA